MAVVEDVAVITLYGQLNTSTLEEELGYTFEHGGVTTAELTKCRSENSSLIELHFIQGRTQFLLDAIDKAVTKSTSGLEETEALIDRFPIDLELRVGPTFTQQTRYTGIYNLATIDVSFRVECSVHYLGSNCTTLESEALSEVHTGNQFIPSKDLSK